MTDIGENSLTNIHGTSNFKKALGYWIGFLEGVMACKEITANETEALKAQSLDLLSQFFDEDAAELVTELEQSWPEVSEELNEFISDIISFRRDEIQLADDIVNEHIFFGFLKGIASDDEVNLNEVNALISHFSEKAWEREELSEDPRIKDIFKVASLAVQDGVIDAEESRELCEYITRVVGDSYSDTGISSQMDTPQLDGMLHSLDQLEFAGREFCLTGTFSVPKAVLGKAIQAKGGSVNRGLRANTDYLVLSNSGSEHYVTANAGTKILNAIKLREKAGKPSFVMEGVLLPILDELQ